MSAPLRRMMEPASVAIVGASARPGSFGEIVVEQLLTGGYGGAIWPVNPRYDEVLGLECRPSMEKLPGPPDVAVLAVSNTLVEEQLRAGARAGAASAVIFASCYEPPAPGSPPLVERLGAIARDAGMAVCGGNCMGFLNTLVDVWICGFAMPPGLRPGPLAFISHSGSAFSAMAYNDRGLRFNLVVSAGQELATSAADYLDYALDQPGTRAVGMFLETVRAPEGFVAGLRKAAERDIAVVALKAGRVGRAKELITAHSGALAGEDGAYEAVFRTHGVIRVDSLDEMADTLELFSSGRPASPGGLAAVHDSGGERALLIDAAAEVGVGFAPLTQETTSLLEATLEEGLPPVNPLDAWGTGNDFEPIFERCMDALLADPGVAALAFSVDLTGREVPETGYVRVAKRVFAGTDKPMAILCNLASAIDPHDATFLRKAGVPILESTLDGLRAFRHLFEYRDARSLPPLAAAPTVSGEVSQRWRAALAGPVPLSERDALRLLSDYGIPVVQASPASDEVAAIAAAEAIGWPVALKTAAPGVSHKSDVDGVVLDLRDARGLSHAYAAMARRLGPAVLIEAMAPAGTELALGVVRDGQFGPVVMVAAGGVLVEVMGDRAWAQPPLDLPRAERLLDALACRPLLEGARGSPPADLDSVLQAIVRLSALAVDLGGSLDALDVNPLVAGPWGCVAIDALVVARR